MKNSNFYLGLIVALIIVIAILVTCNKCGHSSVTGSKTDTLSVKRDTVVIHDKKDTVYIPKLTYVHDTTYIPKYRNKIDSFIVFEKQPEKKDTGEAAFIMDENVLDSAAIVKDWLSVREYQDTQRTKYGNIFITDLIGKNSILSRRLITDFTIPLINESVTVNQKRWTGYLGFSLMGSKVNPLYAYGFDFGLQSLKKRIYSLGVKYSIHSELFFEGEIKYPIHFGKTQ